MASRRRLLLAVGWLRTKIAAALACHLTCVLLLAGTGYALDPNKRLTQYMHTSWRIQDGSAPSGMYTIAQTSDGFLWFLSSRGDIYRFDGVQFRPWRQPDGAGSIGKIRNIVGDQAGGLWALGADGIAHLKDGVVTSHVQLDGLEPNLLNISEDNDGSIWVVRGDNGIAEPVCHVSEQASSATANRMEFRLPRLMPFWRTGEAVFGSGDRLPLSTGMPACRKRTRSKA